MKSLNNFEPIIIRSPFINHVQLGLDFNPQPPHM